MTIPGTNGLTMWGLLKKMYEEFVDDAVADSAATLSYYFLFALFPFLFFLVTLTAYLPLGAAVNDALSRLHTVMPQSAMGLIEEHLKSLLEQPRPNLLTLGFLTALWTASRGVDAMRKALNLAYDVKESRPFWKTQVLALAMTVVTAILILVALAAFVLGGKLGFLLAGKLGVTPAFAWLWSFVRWPFTAVLIMTVAALCFYALPDVEQDFRFITPGSVIGTTLWLAATWGFTQYVEHFGKYNVTYGSIGGVVVLMLWMYISGLIFLIGGELNAVLEHANVSAGKVKGARAEGELPAPPEQRPSIASPGSAKRADAAERSSKRVSRLKGLRFWRRPKPPRLPEPQS